MALAGRNLKPPARLVEKRATGRSPAPSGPLDPLVVPGSPQKSRFRVSLIHSDAGLMLSCPGSQCALPARASARRSVALCDGTVTLAWCVPGGSGGPPQTSLARVVTSTLAATSFAVVGANPAAASSTVMYVAGGGRNSGDCSSSASPCATITCALKHDGGGGVTIDVSGTIADNVTITSSAAPATDPIVIRKAPGAARAVVNGKAEGSDFTIFEARSRW